MAGEDDEIVVTIEGETPEPQDEVVRIQDDTTKKSVVENDDIIDSLKAQLAEKETALSSATQRASSAEALAGQATQRARQAEQEANEARTQAAESTKTTIESGIAAAKAEAQAAQEALVSAGEAGDWKALAAAQRRVARAESELTLLEQAKADLPVQPTRKVVEQPQQTTQADPVEAFINGQSAVAQAFLRKHIDWVRDPKKYAKIQAAHFDAEAEGIPRESPQYFDHIEKFAGMVKSPTTQQQTTQQTTTQTQRRPTAPVAPVTSSGGGVSGGATEVRLSAAEARAAQDGTVCWNWDDPKGRFKKGDPVGVQEYARRKAAMMKEGRYQNISVDGS